MEIKSDIRNQNSIVIPFLYKRKVAEALRFEPGPRDFKSNMLPLSQGTKLMKELIISFSQKKKVAEALRFEPGPRGFKPDMLPLSQEANLRKALIISDLTLLKV